MGEVPKRFLIIANGNTKKEISSQMGNALVAEAKKRGHTAVLHVTKTPEEAQGLLAGDLEDVEAVIAIGGDGTALKVAEGLRQKHIENNTQEDPTKRKRVPKLVTPRNKVGSIQVFGTALAMPSKPDEIFDVIEEGNTQQVRLGTVSIDGGPERVFVSNASAGLSGELFDRDRSKGQKGGTWGYLRKVPQVLFGADYVGGNIKVIREYDKNDQMIVGVNRSGEKVTDVFVHNGGNLGTFPINSEKQYDSGDLAVIIFHGRTGPRRGALREAHALIHDSHSSDPSTREDRVLGKEIVISGFLGKVKVQGDGDFFGTAEKEVRFGTDSVVLEVYTAKK